MNETSTEFADYEPPMLAQVGDFTEDTLGNAGILIPDSSVNYFS